MALRIVRTLAADGNVSPWNSGAGSQPEPTVVGTAPQWADDSDATYAEFHGIAHTSNPNFSDGALGYVGPFPDLLDEFDEIVQINVRMRVKGTGHDVRMPNVGLQESGGRDTRCRYLGGDPAPTSPTWVSYPMELVPGYGWGDILTFLRDDGLNIESRVVWGPDPGFTYSNSWTIYEMRFDVMGLAYVAAPSCRKFPRADGLGVGGGRHFPPPKSQQRSGRRFGYY